MKRIDVSIVSTIDDDRPAGPEIKNNENRVAVTPAGVDALVRRGHEVLVESGAGIGSRIADDDFAAAGASIVPTAD